MRRLPLLLTFLASMLAAAPALAWSTLGHQMVGELAQRHLTPAAQAEVATMLAGEPDPSLSGVAKWADELRAAESDRFKTTASWHYINAQGGGCRFDRARDCPDGNCVVGAIETQLAILGDRTQPLQARNKALKFVVHFVGDVHQPMHAGNRPDRGGNSFQISLRTPLLPEAYARKDYTDGVMGTNLHAVWDYYILASRGLSLVSYSDLLDAMPWPRMPDGALSPPLAWARESCRLIDSRGLYPPQHTMDHGYLNAMRPLAEQRVRQAAWRLAAVLNEALGR